MSRAIRTLLGHLYDAVIAITPTSEEYATYRAWTGPGPLSAAEGAAALRSIRWSVDAVRMAPMSQQRDAYYREAELALTVAYPDAYWPAQGADRLGVEGLRAEDEADIAGALSYGRYAPLQSEPSLVGLVYLGATLVGPLSVLRWRLTYQETAP